MKKIGKILALILVFALTMSVAACGKKPLPVVTLNSIAIIEGSFKTTYRQNETLDLSKALITVKLSDKTESTVAVKSDMVTGFDSASVASNKKLTVSYKKDDITKTADFTYSVLAPQTTQEKYVEMLDKNLQREQYCIKTSMGGTNYYYYTQREPSGILKYCNMVEGSSSEAVYQNGKFYNFNDKTAYKCDNTVFSALGSTNDLLYKLSNSEYGKLSLAGNKFSVELEDSEKFEIEFDNNSIITKIIYVDIDYTLDFNFTDEFVRADFNESEFIVLQTYEVEIVCGCDKHIDGKFTTDILYLDASINCKKADQELAGIYTDSGHTKLVTPLSITKENCKLYLAWQNKTVFVRFNGANNEVNIVNVEIGKTIESFDIRQWISISDNQRLEGWYTEQDLTNKFDFTTLITERTELYPKLISDNRTKYDVNIYYMDGQTERKLKTIETRKDDTVFINFEYDSVADGKIVEGFYTDKNFTTSHNLKTPITATTTLYAKLITDTRAIYKVTVMCEVAGHEDGHTYNVRDGKSFNKNVIANDCSKASNPGISSLSYLPELTGGFDYYSQPIQENTTLYVEWRKY